MTKEKENQVTHLDIAVQELCGVVTPNLAKLFLNLAVKSIKENPLLNPSAVHNAELIKEKMSNFFEFLAMQNVGKVSSNKTAKNFRHE